MSKVFRFGCRVAIAMCLLTLASPTLATVQRPDEQRRRLNKNDNPTRSDGEHLPRFSDKEPNQEGHLRQLNNNGVSPHRSHYPPSPSDHNNHHGLSQEKKGLPSLSSFSDRSS